MAPPRSRVRFSMGANFQALGLKNSLTMPRPLSGYVSCLPLSGWAVVEWAVVAGPLVMGGQGSGIFSPGPLVPRLLKLQSARAAIPSPVEFFNNDDDDNDDDNDDDINK
jgi:hypothetical protein